MKVTTKKPVWSTYIWALDGTGSVVHNYADGTDSGPLPVFRGGYPPFRPYYRRTIDEDLG